MKQNLPDQLTLEKDTIQVYYLNLDEYFPDIKLLENNLSEDEKIRAKKFKFEHLKNRFIVCRSYLRILLGKYLNIPPSDIKFNYTDKGKPYLSLPLFFNVSHSENMALYGFSINGKIGVDIEYIREIKDLEKLAHRFFHPYEYQLIINSNNQKKKELFFTIWTAKEAYLKAIGEGISGGLNNIEIDNLYLKVNNNRLENWQLYNSNYSPNFKASLVINSTHKLPLFEQFLPFIQNIKKN